MKTGWQVGMAITLVLAALGGLVATALIVSGEFGFQTFSVPVPNWIPIAMWVVDSPLFVALGILCVESIGFYAFLRLSRGGVPYLAIATHILGSVLVACAIPLSCFFLYDYHWIPISPDRAVIYSIWELKRSITMGGFVLGFAVLPWFAAVVVGLIRSSISP